jgi:hypothetical protein
VKPLLFPMIVLQLLLIQCTLAADAVNLLDDCEFLPVRRCAAGPLLSTDEDSVLWIEVLSSIPMPY